MNLRRLTTKDCRAFTMIEVVTSMAISSILLVAIGSAMVLAGRALPASDGPMTAALSTASVVDKITAEMQYALQFSERTSQAIQFTIPDRDGDGKPEKIRYTWSGVAGAPLLRSYNGGNAAQLLPSVQSLSFSCAQQQVQEQYPGPLVEDDEILLAAHAPANGTYVSSEHYLNPFSGAGQFIKPVLPADAVKYRVTRAVIVAKRNSAFLPTGTVRVGIHKANASKLPEGSALDSATIAESALSVNFGAVLISFGNAGVLDPSQHVCLVVENALNLLTAGRVEYCSGSGGGMLTQSAGSWSHNGSNSLRYAIYGRASKVTTRTVTRTHLTTAHLSLATLADGASRVDTAIYLPNRPEVLDAQWETHFDENPITADRNLDGQSDWRSSTGFDTSKLSDGTWKADRAIDSNPVNSFNDFLAVDVSMRDTTSGGSGAGIEMRIEATLLGHGIIEGYIAKQSDGTQTFTLQTRDLLLLPKVLLTVSNLSADFQKLRLYVNPDNDSVAVLINEVAYGSYTYNRSVDLSDGVIRLFSPLGETGAEFDSIRVRVGAEP